ADIAQDLARLRRRVAGADDIASLVVGDLAGHEHDAVAGSVGDVREAARRGERRGILVADRRCHRHVSSRRWRWFEAAHASGGQGGTTCPGGPGRPLRRRHSCGMLPAMPARLSRAWAIDAAVFVVFVVSSGLTVYCLSVY